MKSYIGVFFLKSAHKLNFHLNLTRITGTLHNDLRTFMIVSGRIILRMATISDKRGRGQQNPFLFHNPPPPPEIRTAYEIMRKHSTAKQATDDNKIRRMRFAFWITTDTDTHSEYARLRFLFHGNNGYGNALQCYVIHTLPVLFSSIHACCMPHPSHSP
jgi:hypothetical protein